MSVTVILNTRVIQTMGKVEVLDGVDIVIEDSVIKAVGKNAADGVKADKTIHGDGKTVMPGWVCGHHHYYSGLSRGMQISAGPQTDFIQVLKEWWWRLDRGLDEESCLYSSLICSMDAIAAGTTCCIDHHASPNYIEGSLSTIAEGMKRVGVRGATCYEVTDRNFGMKEIRDGVAENVRFAKEIDAERRSGKEVTVEAMIGGHAPFTVPDEGLDLMAEACKATGRGVHFHVAEDKYDVVWSHHLHNQDIIDRLDSHNLLSEKSLLVHGLWLSETEVEKLNERGCFFAHNARSNMNNNVGYCKNLTKVKKLILGTDGCGGNMYEEGKIAFFKNRDTGGPFWPVDILAALTKGNDLASMYLGYKLGRIEKGYKADLQILDYNNPTPLIADNAAGHIFWGMSSNTVESVMVGGKLLFENHKFTQLDPKEVYSKAAEVAKKVWERTDKIKP